MIVIDSDVLIWLLRGNLDITAKFKATVVESAGNVFVSPIQIAEIYAGMLPKEKQMIEDFFSSLQTVKLDGNSGRLGGEFMSKYRKSHNVTLADALTAAVCRHNGHALWTMNKKHYPMLRADEFYQPSIK